MEIREDDHRGPFRSAGHVHRNPQVFTMSGGTPYAACDYR
jgi:hypothetical protein